MDIVNVITEYLQDFLSKSESVYHVNPWVFGVLFFGSAIPLYYGYYRIAKSVIHFEKGKFHRIKVNHRDLRTGVVISCIAWLLPYAYVLIFGRLPLEILVVFTVFVLVTGALFVRTLMKRISKAEEK